MRSRKLETPDPTSPSRARTPLLIGLASVTLTACASAPTATGTRLGPETSRHLFARDGAVRRVEVAVPRSNVMAP